jgi:16S rRNA processing protein RimM
LNNSGPANPGKSPNAADDFVTVAKVFKPQGRKGEVAAGLFTDFPKLFASRKRLFALDAHGHRRELELEDHWPHKGHVILKFKGIDSISDAEALAGCEIQIPRSERAALQGDAVYVSDLIGCTVYDSGREVGRIENVQFGAGEAPLLVVKGAKEYLVPFAGEYLEKILPEQKRIEMKLPEGMLELDAPVTAEEKQRQKSK